MRHSPSRPTWPPFVLAVCGLFALAAVACAADAFPRGPGLYYSPFKLGLVIASFLAWVKLCAWVHVDTIGQKIRPYLWNGLMLAAGLLGLLLVWVMSSFGAAWLAFWVLVLGALFTYIHYRDSRAHQDDLILTKANAIY